MSEGPPEICHACGFDSNLYNRADTISSQHLLPAVLAAASEGLAEATLAKRPDDVTWSIIEYLDHLREVVFGSRMAIEIALSEPGADLGDPPEMGIFGPSKSLELDATLAALKTEYQSMGELLRGLTDEQWQISVVLEGHPHSVAWFARHVLHDGQHHLADIGRIRQGLGQGPPPQSGSVSGMYVSNGGVPKQAITSASVTARGVAGDSQNDRRHHGRPLQAVCLWSAEVIESLRAEGHAIHAGAAGENITIEGIEWSDLRPGARIEVGAVPLLITAHAIPCAKNAQWFNDRDFNRILHQRHPGASRLYAIPLADGVISVADSVSTET
ncbi:MAG: MOSC domain-containing protein [Acidimicrobiales bacterium]